MCEQFVGLGNDGPQFRNTRHNMGMILLDQLAKKWNPNQSWVLDRATGGWIWEHSSNLNLSDAGKDNNKELALCIVLLKPNEFMNLNGKSVLKAVKKLNAPLSNVFLIHDDLERQIGKKGNVS